MARSPACNARGVSLSAHLTLAVGLVLWCGWKAGAILSLPLLGTVQGLVRGKVRSGIWAAYMLIFYVAALVAEAYAVPQRHVVGLILACIAMLDFVCVILFIRWSTREHSAQTVTSARTVPSADVAHRARQR